MDQTQLLIEYLKEHYAQARQHENRQTSATTFLTAAAGVILGLLFKDGILHHESWWMGVPIILIGLANLWINTCHYWGNRFHTAVAGRTRRAIEQAILVWTVAKPTEIRDEILGKQGWKGPNISIGGWAFVALQLVPFVITTLGIAIVVFALYFA